MAQAHPFVSQQTLELCLHSQCQVLAGVPCLSPKALNGISILILSLHMLGFFSQCTGMNPGLEKENKNLQTESEGTEKPGSHTSHFCPGKWLVVWPYPHCIFLPRLIYSST